MPNRCGIRNGRCVRQGGWIRYAHRGGAFYGLQNIGRNRLSQSRASASVVVLDDSLVLLISRYCFRTMSTHSTDKTQHAVGREEGGLAIRKKEKKYLLAYVLFHVAGWSAKQNHSSPFHPSFAAHIRPPVPHICCFHLPNLHHPSLSIFGKMEILLGIQLKMGGSLTWRPTR